MFSPLLRYDLPSYILRQLAKHIRIKAQISELCDAISADLLVVISGKVDGVFAVRSLGPSTV
jgi:hypothetical protein